jgi:hypothetical protein
MLTGQIAPSVPFLVTPANSPQQVEKAAKTRFLAKDVRETQELISAEPLDATDVRATSVGTESKILL